VRQMSDDGMSPDQIERVFGALARIEQKIDGHTAWMLQHVADDKIVADRVAGMQLAAAKQKGFMAGISLLGVIISTAVGWILDWKFGGGHSH
jgi:hypothetical protein